MKIAVPVGKQQTFYHSNPYTAPRFAIYLIEGDRENVSFSLSAVLDNPWSEQKCDAFEEGETECSCSSELQKDMQHICGHYALLDVVGGCSYLLADRFCKNTSHALKNGGVTLFKIPGIIHDVEIAVQNFLIGASLASTIQHIHNAS